MSKFLPGHAGRPRGSLNHYKYTWADIADAAGTTIARAKRHGSRSNRKFDPSSLKSVMLYCVGSRLGQQIAAMLADRTRGPRDRP